MRRWLLLLLSIAMLSWMGCDSSPEISPDRPSKKKKSGKKTKAKKKKKKKTGGKSKKKKATTENRGDGERKREPASPPELPEAPKPPPAPPPRDGVPGTLPSASLDMQNVSAGGLVALRLQCNGLVDMGYVMQTIAGLTTQADAIKRCATSPAKPRVIYSMVGGLTSGVKATADDKKVADCIVAAVSNVKSTMASTCLVTLDLKGS